MYKGPMLSPDLVTFWTPHVFEQEFPPKSIFPSDVYGPASGLTREHIEPFLNGLTVEKVTNNMALYPR